LEKTKVVYFSPNWKTVPKDKCIHKYKHNHIYIYRENMFSVVGQFNGITGSRERKRE
jgi:hypothetical protein